MINIKKFGYTIHYEENMSYTINKEKKLLIFLTLNNNEYSYVHCILDFSKDNVMLRGGYTCNYILRNKEIKLIEKRD